MKKLCIVIIALLILLSLGFLLLAYDIKDNSILNKETDKNLSVENKNIIEILKNSNIEIPIYENLIPQGLVIVDDNIFISVYDNFGLVNSKVYVIDKDGNIINVITLDTNSHVGGLAYDRSNNLLWIPDNDGVLNAYNIKDFYKKSHTYYKYHFTNLADDLIDFTDEGKRSIDYLTIVDNNLYIGNFSLDNRGLAKKYRIKKNNEIELELLDSFRVPNKVQGISLYKNYLLLSTSYGRKKPSYLYIYDYDKCHEENTKPIIEFKLPSMMEQIYVYNDRMYLIFESTAKKYYDSIDKIGYIGMIDIEDLIKE